MPSYDGVAIFGLAVSMSTSDNPSAEQMNSFFGVSGLESLYGGQRGRVTNVTGVLAGPDAASLSAAEEEFRAYNDGRARTLVDTRGVTWFQVKLRAFVPQGRILFDLGRGYYRPYAAQFAHLI